MGPRYSVVAAKRPLGLVPKVFYSIDMVVLILHERLGMIDPVVVEL